MTRKILIFAAALMTGTGTALAGPATANGDGKPQLCTNDRAKVDARHIYSAECPSISAMRRADGAWVPANDGPGKPTSPTIQGEPGVPSDAAGKPTAPDMGSGGNY